MQFCLCYRPHPKGGEGNVFTLFVRFDLINNNNLFESPVSIHASTFHSVNNDDNKQDSDSKEEGKVDSKADRGGPPPPFPRPSTHYELLTHNNGMVF